MDNVIRGGNPKKEQQQQQEQNARGKETKRPTEMNNAVDVLIRLNMAGERISKLEDLSIETSKTKKQRTKTENNRTEYLRTGGKV